MTGPLRRLAAGGLLPALLLAAAGISAQVLEPAAPFPPQAAEQEPITPIPPPPPADPLKVALGERLFDDPRLSRDGQRACSSCHDPHTNGADGNRLDTTLEGAPLRFNTSTVFNAALSFRLDWAGGFRTLEAQAASSLESPDIMGTSIDAVLDKLRNDPDMVARFRETYGAGPDRASLLDAIATFERSLLTPGSPFDRWLQGDPGALTAEAQDGYRLFKSLGCVSCHQGVNIGGNLFQRHGIFHPLASPDPAILRVPSLRNIATTAPYFHDGSAATLDEAVRNMALAQLDRTLSDPQVAAITAFLRSLTGTYKGHPVTAP
ncbi:cytochrome-c peroxidase [Inquilinus limosus]|uniref:cytochrome-c peroxidase n=1 Tax=Inquilinus limosus TaxID=171674 RepID=UPI000AAAC291|nr:cytochrome c peroxidase [Inquilinus limosus]